MYLENCEMQEEMLSREQAQAAHWYLNRLSELFRAKQHSSSGDDFHKAARNRTLAASLAWWIEKEYDINYIDSSLKEHKDV